MTSGILAEAYQRLHHAGPEWDDNSLTNHGPMTVEVLVRRGHAADVHPWVDAYVRRLDDLPAASDRITDDTWRDALGKADRIADWTAYLTEATNEAHWRDLLATWWPRLLPAIAAGTTHGVIRVGHAVRALAANDETAESAETVTELAHGLAFWAARARHVPGVVPPGGRLDARAALHALPRVPEQHGTVANRFRQLAEMADWPTSLTALRAPTDPDDAHRVLTELVDAAAVHYLGHGHTSPVLLVHTATAPNAVLHCLPALPRELWSDSLTAAWAACAAITVGWAPGEPAPSDDLPAPPDAPDAPDVIAEMLDRAVANGDEHVIKFTDTATEVYARTGDPASLTACLRVASLIGG
jgi:hypothetical protein